MAHSKISLPAKTLLFVNFWSSRGSSGPCDSLIAEVFRSLDTMTHALPVCRDDFQPGKDSAQIMKLPSESAVADESKVSPLALNRGMGGTARVCRDDCQAKNQSAPSMARLYRGMGGTARACRGDCQAKNQGAPSMARFYRGMGGKIRIFLLAVLMIPWATPAAAYSLLTHEQLIDLTWKDSIVPLLLSRYPNLTHAQLDEARAYAYGGCVIQDIGYYPFGDHAFSNLTHYVRSGDFVIALFRNAKDANETAFAIGALSHYIGDTIGHPSATNLAVPMEFPKLRAKYGPVVNYAQGQHQHVRAEFAFDINEIAHHRAAPIRYFRHIGLQVSVRQLALAFYQTYGLSEDFSTKRGRRFNVRGYRFAVQTFIPRIADAITLLHRRHEPADPDTPEAKEIRKETAAIALDNDWQYYRRKAGIGTYALAGFLFIIPKIGPLSMVAVKGPNDTTEADYMHSVAVSTAALRRILARFTPVKARSTHVPALLPDLTHEEALRSPFNRQQPLANRDLDTGTVVRPGGYPLTDSTYADLLHQLTRQPTEAIPPRIKQDVQAYYANLDLPITTKKDPARWAQVQADLAILAAMPTSTEPQPYPTYGDDAGNAQ